MNFTKLLNGLIEKDINMLLVSQADGVCLETSYQKASECRDRHCAEYLLQPLGIIEHEIVLGSIVVKSHLGFGKMKFIILAIYNNS
jgi:hypothetical protein